MQEFQRETLSINGVDTVVLSAGNGPPLVYLHGAGTLSGFGFAAPWTQRYKVIVPYHPGFGESADDPRMDDIHDYAMHYLELFEAMGLEGIRLVGQSTGGWMACVLAVEHRELLDRLALVCPIGVPVPPEHATTDIYKLPPEELPATLAANVQTVLQHIPPQPGPEFFAARQRETESGQRLIGRRTYDPKLPRYLHRLTMPVMLVWGTSDRLTPFAQLDTWRRHLPRAEVRTFDDAGHLVLDEAPESVAAIAEFFAA